MKELLRLRYYPLWARTALVVVIFSLCALAWLLFGVRVSADPDPEIKSALALVDSDASAALHLLDSYVPRDSDNAARAAALRSFARFLEGYDDTARSMLDTAAIITLRRNGLHDNPVLARALLAYGMMASNRGEYQIAVNALGESADRALSQLADTLLAARAYRNLGNTFSDLSALQSGIHYLSIARDLFTALNQQGRADLCRTTIINILARSFDKSEIEKSLSILDSIKPRVDRDSDYSEYLTFSTINIQPRLRAGLYDQAIYYGKKTLTERYCRSIDSMWAYSHMAKAAIGLHSFNEARQWLDSARRFQHMISRRVGGNMISLTGIELALVDSLAHDSRIKELRRTFDAENDSLFAMYKGNIAQIRPSYTLEADHSLSNGQRHGAILVIILAIVLSGIALIVYYHKISDLRYRMDLLVADNDTIARKASALAKEIADAEARIAALSSDLITTRHTSSQMSRELEERQALLASTQESVELLSARLREARQAAAASKGFQARQIEALIVPYISAVDNLICSVDFSETVSSGSRKACELELRRLLDYLRSDSFAESLPLAAAIREPGLSDVDSGLRELLTPEAYKVFMMIIAGFSSQAIIIITELSRQSYYRRRDLIVARLLDSGNDYYQILADKYIRRFTKSKKNLG